MLFKVTTTTADELNHVFSLWFKGHPLEVQITFEPIENNVIPQIKEVFIGGHFNCNMNRCTII